MTQINRVWLVGICRVLPDGRRQQVDVVFAFGSDEIEAARGAAEYVLDVLGPITNGHVFRCAPMRQTEQMAAAWRYLQVPNGDEIPSEMFDGWTEVRL